MTLDERLEKIALLNEENSRAIAENARVVAENSKVVAENSRVVAENAKVAAENSRVAAEHSRQLAIDGQHINQLANIAADTSESVRRLANSVDHLLETVAQHESRIHRLEDRP
jgi:methyl-accepting chemotaxis protein